ncbi:MAG: hypothetical protein IPK50_04555 [Fibrobacterota bacterium]|nr:hypothetical protein [Fibrobacterota bacterium]QQS06167.1 MAG: hypothetical protein IPK50_04555 [Fibrobacterota bacterium]
MKLHPQLLALLIGSASFALPLHPGNSWVWQVSNRANQDLTFRSASVLDSQSLPQGTLWRVVTSDSLSQARDTASILVASSGHQQWLRRSALLTWELQPFQPGLDSLVVVGPDTTSRWGEASCLPPGNHWSDNSATLSDRGFGFGYPKGYRIQMYPTPFHLWSDSNGLQSAVVFPSLQRRMDWRLVSRNGQAIPILPDSLFLPRTGTEFVWKMEVHTTTRRIDSLVRWKIGTSLPDSAGWTGLTVTATRSRCNRTLWIDDTNPDGTLSFGPCEEGSSQEVNVRLNPKTGQYLTSEERRSPFPESWLCHRETTTSASGFRSIDQYWEYRQGMSDTIQSTSSLSRQGRLLKWSEYTYTMWWSDYDSLRTEYQLVQPLDPGDSLQASVRRRTPRSFVGSLNLLAQAYPTLAIRWSTASGRTGILVASEIVQRPATLRGKTLFLQARLPDGRLWQGTHVVP